MIALQIKINNYGWFTLAARKIGEASREAELLARVELVRLRNEWIVSGYFPQGTYRIARV